jgi:hypothetical protein
MVIILITVKMHIILTDQPISLPLYAPSLPFYSEDLQHIPTGVRGMELPPFFNFLFTFITGNLIKIRSTHLLPIFYRFFFTRDDQKKKSPIENREQVRRSNFN